MEIVGYSYSFGPITGPRPIDNARAIRWFHERGITSLELYDPWMEDEDEVLRVEEAIAATGMKALMCDGPTATSASATRTGAPPAPTDSTNGCASPPGWAPAPS